MEWKPQIFKNLQIEWDFHGLHKPTCQLHFILAYIFYIVLRYNQDIITHPQSSFGTPLCTAHNRISSFPEAAIYFLCLTCCKQVVKKGKGQVVALQFQNYFLVNITLSSTHMYHKIVNVL